MQNNSSPKEQLKPTTITKNFSTVLHSIAMLAGMELDVFTPLKDGPLKAEQLARALGVQEDKLTPLLYSLVVAGLLTVENDKFCNTEEAATFLVRGCPEYIGDLHGFYKRTWTSALNTAETIRTGKPQAKLDFRNASDEELLSLFRKQIHSSLSGGKEIAEKIDFSPFETVLDAGGGTGGVSMAICAKYPHVKATVADFPKVTQLAERFIAEAGLSDRISVAPTDLCSHPPRGQYDAAILRALIQTLSKEEAQSALKHIGQSLKPGGQLFIFGSILQNSRLAPSISVANNMIFMNVYDHGRSYTEEEYTTMLTHAGFTNITVTHEVLADGMGLVAAKKR